MFVDLDLTINLGETSYVDITWQRNLSKSKKYCTNVWCFSNKKRAYGADTGKFLKWFSAKFQVVNQLRRFLNRAKTPRWQTPQNQRPTYQRHPSIWSKLDALLEPVASQNLRKVNIPSVVTIAARGMSLINYITDWCGVFSLDIHSCKCYYEQIDNIRWIYNCSGKLLKLYFWQ